MIDQPVVVYSVARRPVVGRSVVNRVVVDRVVVDRVVVDRAVVGRLVVVLVVVVVVVVLATVVVVYTDAIEAGSQRRHNRLSSAQVAGRRNAGNGRTPRRSRLSPIPRLSQYSRILKFPNVRMLIQSIPI